jgi:putative protein-disulfide isomerase
MDKTLYYLFDPLCGWCYGASPALSVVLESEGARLALLPTGLFSGEGARAMDDAFAAYAWTNDQRIERLTGQGFSEPYRTRVLGNRQQLFDSGPATLALTAVSLTAPAREFLALKAIQHARYVDGNDVTSLAVLAGVLGSLGFEEAATKLANPDAALLDANRARVGRAQALMREQGARGVPALVVESGGKRRMLDLAASYANPRALIGQLEAA